MKSNYDKLKEVEDKLADLAIEFQQLENKLPKADAKILSSDFVQAYNILSGMHAYVRESRNFVKRKY